MNDVQSILHNTLFNSDSPELQNGLFRKTPYLFYLNLLPRLLPYQTLVPKLLLGSITIIMLSLIPFPYSIFSKTITVSHSTKYNSLKSALNSVQNGDKIIIESGTYNDFDIQIDKSLIIEGRNNPIFDANINSTHTSGKSILKIRSDNVTISGLTFKNTPVSFIKEFSAILLDSVKNCNISNNKFTNNFFAIYISRSWDCSVSNNVIIGRKSKSEANAGNGIHLWYSKNISLINNTIINHRDGLYLEFVEDAIIKNNISKNNIRYGLHFMFSHRCHYISNQFISNGGGVAVMYSKNVEMTNNIFQKNWGKASYGLLIKDITDSKIESNIFESNSIGILIENSSRNQITKNHIQDNGWAVKINTNSMDNAFSLNNFVGNTFDVASHGKQNHNKFFKNYWSNYSGYDLNKDGYGDVPYRPVKLFSVIVQQNSPALILLKSMFVYLIDLVEQIIPSITPETLVDSSPLMKFTKFDSNKTRTYNNNAKAESTIHNFVKNKSNKLKIVNHYS